MEFMSLNENLFKSIATPGINIKREREQSYFDFTESDTSNVSCKWKNIIIAERVELLNGKKVVPK